MTRRLVPMLALALALAACSSPPDPTPSPSVEPLASPSATAEPTQAPTATSEATPSPAPDGSFAPGADAEADALFLERDECQNPRDGYQLIYPDDWYTNTELRDVAPCSWFSPTFYEVGDPGEVPDEVAITILWLPNGFGYTEDPISQIEGIIGGQNALRFEFEDSYGYVIQLGPSFGEGPNLLARTARDMGGDYELNKAVLDRLMLTIEFIGSTQ